MGLGERRKSFSFLHGFPELLLFRVPNIQRGFSVLLFSLQWLNEARIIQRLVELIHSSQDEDVSGTRAGVWAAGSCRILEVSVFLVPVTCGGATADGLGVSQPLLSTKCGVWSGFICFWLLLLPISWFCCLSSSQTFRQWGLPGIREEPAVPGRSFQISYFMPFSNLFSPK